MLLLLFQSPKIPNENLAMSRWEMKSQVEHKAMELYVSEGSGHQSHYYVRLHDKAYSTVQQGQPKRVIMWDNAK